MPTITIPLADIPEGTPHQPGDHPVLLIRDGDSVTALAHTCPHLGLPLAKGVVANGTLICPFHHACFDAATGRQTQPPGHGDLRRYTATVADGTVTVELTDEAPHPAPPHARQSTDATRVVIAGSGAAADACATTLREEGFEGVIQMISPDGAPYDRTMLSKAVLTGDKPASDLLLTDLSDYDVTLVDDRVTAVAPGRITTASGGTLAYDHLLIAPGGTPNRPDFPGAENTHALRSAPQAAALAQAAGEGGKAAILGAGFIGMEAALSLTKRGLETHVIHREALPLAHIVGPDIAHAILAEHEAAGVVFHAETDATRLDGRTLTLSDGSMLDVDLTLAAIGVTPATADIDGLPTDKDQGVTVAPDLSVPGLPGAYVAGDAARAPTAFGPARIEHWRVARQHGRAAALAMLGRPQPGTIPFFWTALARQYRYLGHAEDWDDIQIDGDPSGPFLARYVKDGQVIAALTAGRDAELATLHLAMLEAGGPIPA